MEPSKSEIGKVLARYDAGGMTRRSFLAQLSALGVTAMVANAVSLSPLGAVKAFAAINGAEERSWELAKAAAAKATKKTLTLLIPTGSIGNMKPYEEKWKKELGITLEFIEEPDEVVHTKGMQEAVAKTGRYDVMMPTAMSYPDWIDSGVIYDLTEWVEKYNPDIFHKEWGVVFPASHHAQLYNGRVAGLLNDGDQITLLCRDDHLKNPEKAKAFADKYGYPPAVPKTWKEYFNLAQFMHDPGGGFYGSLEYRSPYYVKWMFMQRLVSKGRLYFDQDMNPAFNSEEGIAAHESGAGKRRGWGRHPGLQARLVCPAAQRDAAGRADAEGGIVQIAEPQTLYDEPIDREVARMVGSPQINLLEARYVTHENGGSIEVAGGRLPVSSPLRKALASWDRPFELGVRPENLRLADPARAPISAELVDIEPLGLRSVLTVRNPGAELRLVTESNLARNVLPGERVGVEPINDAMLLAFDPTTGHRMS